MAGFDLMGCNSPQDFGFSQLNSLLSWALSPQDENGSVTFKQFESYLNTLNTEQWWLCSFFVLIIKPPLIGLIYYSIL